jgi:hypothetical protein
MLYSFFIENDITFSCYWQPWSKNIDLKYSSTSDKLLLLLQKPIMYTGISVLRVQHNLEAFSTYVVFNLYIEYKIYTIKAVKSFCAQLSSML